MMSMGRLHRSYALTGGICTAIAAALPGTLPHEASRSQGGDTRIGHPAGVLPLSAEVVQQNGGWHVPSVSAYRTARRLMEGAVLVPEEFLDGHAEVANPTTITPVRRCHRHVEPTTSEARGPPWPPCWRPVSR